MDRQRGAINAIRLDEVPLLNQDRDKDYRSITIPLSLLVFSLPLLTFGVSFLNKWRLAEGGDLYYFQYPYLQMASMYLAAALLASGAILYRGLRSNFRGLLIVPISLFLVGAVFFPNLQPLAKQINDSNYITTVAFDCDEWSGAHHRYPSNDSEMQEALRSTTREDTFVKNGGMRPPQKSQYRYQGKLVPYQVVVENKPDGPNITNVSTRPGLVYYKISPDSKEYWLTMTVLSSSTPGFANLLTHNGQPYIIHKKLRDGWSRSE